MRTDQGTARVNPSTRAGKIPISCVQSEKLFGQAGSSPHRAAQPDRSAGLHTGAGDTLNDQPERRHWAPHNADLTVFIRRVPAKLTYPTYSGMHTLVVGFLTVSMHC
jgi:hypothetical protein